MPFYFVLETLPNLRHAVTIFALGMRLKSKRRKTIAAFEQCSMEEYIRSKDTIQK